MLGRGNPCKIGLFLLSFLLLFHLSPRVFGESSAAPSWDGQRNHSIPSVKKKGKKERKKEKIRNVNHREWAKWRGKRRRSR